MWQPNTLVAVTGIFDENKVCRIARVIEDRGLTVVVATDEEIENDAALEYGFENLTPAVFEVSTLRLRLILEDDGPMRMH